MTPVYDFTTTPPAVPELYVTEKHLRSMALYGAMACPYTPPQWTIYPGDGQVGRWTLHFDHDAINELPLPEHDPWKWILERMPGMRIRYEDFGTGAVSVWLLTDQILHRDADVLSHWLGDNDFRKAVWPD